jgi:translation initiation factor IF-2
MRQPLGQTFAPTSAADEEPKKPNPAQQAIQVLSMRIPRVRGAKAISPLVGEPGSAARREVGGFSPHSAVLETLMRSMTPSGSTEAVSTPMGSLPGLASPGAPDPMGAALSGLMGGASMAPPPVAASAPAAATVPMPSAPVASSPQVSVPRASSPQASAPPAASPAPAALPTPPIPFRQEVPRGVPSIPSEPKQAPVIIPGVEEPKEVIAAPKESEFVSPPMAGAGPRDLREPVTPPPRIPDQGERDPRDSRPPRNPTPAPVLPPISEPGPPPGRDPQSPRDPEAPIDLLPVPGEGVNTPDLGLPAPPSFDPEMLAAVAKALFRKGGLRF